MKNKKYLLKFYQNNKVYENHFSNKLKLESIFNNHAILFNEFIEIYNNYCYNYRIFTLKYKRYKHNKDSIIYINIFNENNKIISNHILIKKELDYCYYLFDKPFLKLNNDITLINDTLTI